MIYPIVGWEAERHIASLGLCADLVNFTDLSKCFHMDLGGLMEHTYGYSSRKLLETFYGEMCTIGCYVLVGHLLASINHLC